MSLPRNRDQKSFFDAGYLLEKLFCASDRFYLFQDKILPALRTIRPKLDELYCQDDGRPCIDPLIMAGVTLLQFMEKVPDRKAVEMVTLHLGWKFALDLPLDFSGFHATSLVVFRNRLLEGEQARSVFDSILQALRNEGLVKKRSKQRLDSTHVLGCVSEMSRLEVVRETLRLALKQIDGLGLSSSIEDWQLLVDRYVNYDIDWPNQGLGQLKEKNQHAAEDCLKVLEWSKEQQNTDLLQSDKIALLERVFNEQYEVIESGIQQRPTTDSGSVQNPHDPEAQWASKGKGKDKKKKSWVGYKAQVMETVSEDSEPKKKADPTEQFITEVTTTEAIASDLDGMHRVLTTQENIGEEAPPELYVDAAYVSAETLAEAKDQDRQLIGPALPPIKHRNVFSSNEFDVDIQNRKAVCPGGHTSTQCSLINDAHKTESYYRFEWASHCDNCPLQSSCTTSKTGRRILMVGIHHDLLQERRRDMQDEKFQKLMHRRASIEGTISELTRAGMRRSRYRGLRKTSLANYFLGAACNVNRWIRLLTWQMQGQPG